MSDKKNVRTIDPKDKIVFARCVDECGLDEVPHRPGRGQLPLCAVCRTRRERRV